MSRVRQVPAEFEDKSVPVKIKAVTGVDSLSKRQKEILRLVARHHQIKEIARLLHISEATVRTHTEEARRRLGAATSREAAIVLLRHESSDGSLSEQGLLPDAPPEKPGDAQVADTPAEPVAPDATTQLDSEPMPVPVAKAGRFSSWLKQRSIAECLGVILLIALGLTVSLVALLSSAVTLIQAIQNLTGRN
jgi:DNA-binding CsgD family transcriptional regulator